MLLLSDFEEHEEGRGMIPTNRKCPICRSPVEVNRCGNPLQSFWFAVTCSNDDCRPMSSADGPTKAVKMYNAQRYLDAGYDEERIATLLAADWCFNVWRMTEERKVKG